MPSTIELTGKQKVLGKEEDGADNQPSQYRLLQITNIDNPC